MKKETRRQRRKLTLVISLFIFAALLLSMLLVGAAGMIFLQYDPLRLTEGHTENLRPFVLLLIATSMVLGAVISWLSIHMPLRPLGELIHGLNRLAEGKYDTRLAPTNRLSRWLYSLRFMQKLTDSFNCLARELESTELLRSDFIDNFSHEFKTPIVSIAGFAKLLKRGGLTPEQEREYLAIIEEESQRLSVMATNVLNLSKVENQSILTDVSVYNLSEQLRSCVLLLQRKWEKKQLEMELSFEELTVSGSEELLKEVWINILDNAVKFADEGSTVHITAETEPHGVSVRIEDRGRTIPPASMNRIFGKFYQADESHAAEGNGVGLAIVKRIAELHGGAVRAQSENGVTAFTVFLPQ